VIVAISDTDLPGPCWPAFRGHPALVRQRHPHQERKVSHVAWPPLS